MFLSRRPFVVNTTFSTGFVGVEEETSAPTRPVENVVLTTKGLQKKKTDKCWMGRR